LRKTEDIVDKEEGCQDLVHLCISRSRVVDDRAHPRPTGLTPPVARVATGAVVGATTAMTAPVATSATKRPLPSRPAARRHVLRTRRPASPRPHRARRPSRARCPRPPPHRRVRFDTASAVPTSARWRSEANASGRPGGHTATVCAVSRLRLRSPPRLQKFQKSAGFF
jgi:Ni/Co efflux regulator RcnB